MENNQDNVILNGEPSESENNQPVGNNPQNGAPVNPCPMCGTPYTYVCPKCGFSPYVSNKKAKKSIFAKWWFWLVAVLVMFGIMIGTASCMIFLMASEDTDTSDYKTTSLCEVGDLDVSLIPKESYRDEYTIELLVEVKNNTKEKISFYPTKVLFDGEKGIGRGDFSVDDVSFGWSFDWDSYYAEDESIILQPGKTHLISLSFETEYYDDEDEESSHPKFLDDLRNVNVLEFNLNVANPETLEVLDTTKLTVDLSKIKANKKYYEYE